MIFKAVSADWPAGKASIVTKLLKAKHAPCDAATQVELRQEMNKIKMKKHGDPATMFEQTSSVTDGLSASTAAQVSEEDMIAVTLDAAPAERQAALTSEQRNKGAALKEADLEDAMNQHWRQIKKKGAKEAKEESELTLSAITCYECHEQGHKANKCPKRQGGAGRG